MAIPKNRASDKKTWLQGNSTAIWRISVLTLISLISFLSVFIFTEVAAIPKNYLTIPEFSEMRKEIVNNLQVLTEKVDEINRYLREKK